MINVRYLAKAEIEREAERLLSEYEEETIREQVKLPVPVGDITTSHLALDLRFDDLHQIFGRPMLRDQPDILGAIWIDKELMAIDHRLDPNTNPGMLGRYNFSVAHEIGHWRLHQSYAAEPTEMCRSSQNAEPIE
jgi:hypothetical protein